MSLTFGTPFFLQSCINSILLQPKSVIRPIFISFLAFSVLFMPYQHFFMFHDVTLGRFLYPFSLSQFCLCHISISLCSMTLLGLGRASELSLLSPWVTFGILSTSLSRRSPLRLNFVDIAVARHSKQASSALALRNVRQRCGQSARN